MCLRKLQTFTFNISDYNSGTGAVRYKYGLLMGGTGSSNPILYHVFISENNKPTLTAVLQGARTFTASVSNNQLIISADSTVYGGLRLLWLD